MERFVKCMKSFGVRSRALHRDMCSIILEGPVGEGRMGTGN
jgi:hypothetical protein